MAVTNFSPLLGLALPTTGDLSGAWGTTVNDSITSLLDSAISGTTSLTTDADVTLTSTNAAANEARQAIILWNPASGTTTRNITAPAQSKIYTVINASGGTQSIVFRGVGPTTGVTIIKGESAVVAWNGSDFIKISNTGGGGSFTNVTISGTTTLSGLTASTALALNASKEVVSVTNTGTGNNVLATSPTLVTPALGTPSSATLTNATGLPISTGVSGLGTGVATFLGTPSSANLAAAVTDETGSGALVFATSPTLVTPTLGVATATSLQGIIGNVTPATGAFTDLSFSGTGTVSGGTANGVAYLNGSKVLTTGSALTFDGTNLGVGANITASASSAPSLTVGTGSGSPAITLYSSTTGSSQISFADATSGSGAYDGYILYDQNSQSMQFGRAAAEQMRLTSTGLGLGTSSPAYKLDVVGSSRIGASGASTALLIGSDAATTGGLIFADATRFISGSVANNPYLFYTNNSEKMRLDSSGNLCVGSSSAGNAGTLNASVGNPGTTTGGLQLWSTTTGSHSIQWGDGTSGSDPYRGAIEYIHSGDAMRFYTSASEQMRLTSTGLGIGTSVPTSRLHVRSDANALTVIEQIQNRNAGASAGGVIAFINSTNDLADNRYAYIGAVTSGAAQNGNILVFATNPNGGAPSERMRLDSSGNLGLGVTPSAWNADYKVQQIGLTSSFYGRVASAQTGIGENFYRDAGGTFRYISSGQVSRLELDSGAFYWYTAGSGTAGNAISFTQAMTLTAAGDLLVGTTSTNETSGTGGRFGADGYVRSTRAGSTGAASTLDVYSTGASAFRFYVDMAGTVFATNTTISAISDQRLKENVQDIDAGLDKIMALQPRKFDWKTGKGKNIKGDRGWIAQEFEQVFPDMIDTWKDEAPEGEEPYKSVRADLIPVLVKAMQEQQALITALTARVAALESI